MWNEKPEHLLPRLLLYDVPAGFSGDEVGMMTVQNLCLAGVASEKLRPAFRLGPKGLETTRWVIECSPEMYSKLEVAKRLYVVYTSGRFRDYTGLSRCFKC